MSPRRYCQFQVSVHTSFEQYDTMSHWGKDRFTSKSAEGGPLAHLAASAQGPTKVFIALKRRAECYDAVSLGANLLR
jgi:hypothetical protein